jgi:P-aminobenzoate N-oxygenase AurF
MTASRLKDAIASAGSPATRPNRPSEPPCQNPYTTLKWPKTVDPEREWFGSPELLSLYRTPMWDRLDEPARSRLAFHQAANFYNLNIHGEKSLVQGLAVRLYRRGPTAVADHLHSVLDEEDGHSAFFGGFRSRYARIHPSRQVSFERSRPREQAAEKARAVL